MIDPELKALVDGLVGRRVIRIRRVHYVKPDQKTGATGPIEFTFVDAELVLIDVGPDGDGLRLSTGAWHDPFVEPLSAENRAYVEEVGKWTAFDVTADELYASLIGEAVRWVHPGDAAGGSVASLALGFPSSTVDIRAQADELHVRFVAD